jgi:transposase
MWTAQNRRDYERQGLRYPSDQTDAEWALARPFIAVGKFATPESEARLRAVLDGVLYVLTTGCQWRQSPKDFPPRSTVHGWFVRWHCDGVLDRLHTALYRQARELAGKEASPSVAVVDSQSVKSAENGSDHPGEGGDPEADQDIVVFADHGATSARMVSSISRSTRAGLNSFPTASTTARRPVRGSRSSLMDAIVAPERMAKARFCLSHTLFLSFERHSLATSVTLAIGWKSRPPRRKDCWRHRHPRRPDRASGGLSGYRRPCRPPVVASFTQPKRQMASR